MIEPSGPPLLVCTIRVESDVVVAVSRSKHTLLHAQIDDTEANLVATSIAELSRNIARYALWGTVSLFLETFENSKVVWIVAEDVGPGIPDVTYAITNGYSTGGSLGLGLPGVQRLMDEMYICPDYDRGARIIARKVIL